MEGVLLVLEIKRNQDSRFGGPHVVLDVSAQLLHAALRDGRPGCAPGDMPSPLLDETP